MPLYFIIFMVFLQHNSMFPQPRSVAHRLNKSINGQVLNASDQIKIPYATIIHANKRKGFNTNEEGAFVLEWQGEPDTLYISSVGYNDTLFVLNQKSYQANLTIKLKPKIVVLNELKIINKAPKQKSYTTIKGKSSGIYGGLGGDIKSLLGLYFTESFVLGKHLASVHFYIDKKGIVKAPFKVRIFDFDKTKPIKELSTQNIVVTPYKNGWNEFDVSGYNIIIPENGCLVAMEWLNIIDKHPTEYQKGRDKYNYMYLGLCYIGDEHRGFIKTNLENWYSVKEINPKSPDYKKWYYLNPMIRITVD